MNDLTANRTLVKSPPELWAECSDPVALARHLGAFGDIRITRLEPETTVAWEGERASGTVRLEPSGWGTRVVLTARLAPTPAREREAEQVEEPEAERVEEREAERVEEREAESVEEGEGEQVEEREAESVEEGEGEQVEESEGELVAEIEPAVAPPPAIQGHRRRGLLALLVEAFRRRRVIPAPMIVEPPAIPAEPVAPPEAPAPPTSAEPVAPPEAPAPPTSEEPVARDQPAPADEPAPPRELAEEPPPLDAESLLSAALDSLGQAHHRPFSRA